MLDSRSEKKLVEETRAARMQGKKKQFAQDISSRNPSDEVEKRHSELLDSIRYAQSLFINQDDTRSVFEALLNTLVSITDSEYGFIDEVWSDESGKLFKRNLSISNIAWDEESSKLCEKLKKPAAFEPAGPEEFILSRKDGSEITAEISTYPVTIRRQTYALSVAHDITEHKKAEQALIESERRFRSLSESAFEGIVFSENGLLIDANKAFAEIYRCFVEELIGKPVVELVAPERQEFVAEKIRSDFEGIYESKGIRKDGSLIDIEIHGRTVIHQGRKMRMTAVSDITERKKAFETL